MTTQDLALASPILLPAFAALLVILVDLLPGGKDADGSFFLAFLGALVSLAYTVFYLIDGRSGSAFANTLLVDDMALTATVVIHFSALVAIVLSRTYLRARPDVERPEYHAFILISAAGMAMLASANDLVNVFLGLELLSIPLYVLATSQLRNPRSVEAGLKYLLLGAFASSFLLFGMGLLYGASGTTVLSAMPLEIARLGTGAAGGDTGLLAAFGAVMFLIGLLFKIGAAPFHMWTPDVYEGSPTPVTAFMAAATKAAAFAALLRAVPVLAESLGPVAGARLLSGVAVLTMLVGNLGALRQTNLKRLLAYSSIAHAGYMLVGVAAVVALHGSSGSRSGASAILFYLVVYAVMNLGAFAVAIVLDRGEGKEGLGELRGLGRERPLLAAAMSVFALALAGVPPTAGFLGKLYVFSSAVEAGLLPLAVIAVLMSVIALYYYLRLLILMYVSPAGETAAPGLRVDWLCGAASLVGVVVVLWLGVLPGWLMEFVESSMRGLIR